MNEPEHAAITIALSPTQVDQVVRAAARGRAPSISMLIADSLATSHAQGNGHAPATSASEQPQTSAHVSRGYMLRAESDPRLSRSLLRGFSLLTGFGPDGDERGIVELANELDMSASTAHRYALTLVELGLLERCPRTRKYRLPQI
jgi:IclR helix-turn-helix domain